MNHEIYEQLYIIGMQVIWSWYIVVLGTADKGAVAPLS